MPTGAATGVEAVSVRAEVYMIVSTVCISGLLRARKLKVCAINSHISL